MEAPVLRVGLLIRHRRVAAWERALLKQIVEADAVEVVARIEMQGPGNGRVAPFFESRVAKLLNHWDRKRRILHDAFEHAGDIGFAGEVRMVALPESNGPTSVATIEAVDQVRSCELDVIIALDDCTVMSQLGAAARLGLWHFLHGVSAGVSGSPDTPVGLREVLHRRPYLVSTLEQCDDGCPGGRRIDTTYSNVNARSYKRTRSEHFWKVSAMIPRILRRLGTNGEGSLDLVLSADALEKVELEAEEQPWSTARLLIAWMLYVSWRFWSAIRRRLTREHWILMVNLGQDPFDIDKYAKLEPRKGCFWADPFLIREKGRNFVFFEEASLKTGKGHISVIKLDDDGNHSPSEKVLEKDYHLSYPFTFRWQDEWYMIPESAENRTVELYRCMSFPDEWVLERTLMDNVAAYDATLFEHDSTWWLFAGIRERDGASDWDELSLFYSDDPVHGVWTPHPMNPVVSDVRSARPGGRLFRLGGRVIRPSQDSSYRYGYRLVFNEIVELSKTRYRERLYRVIEPGSRRSILGTHTFSRCKDVAVIDAIHRVSRAL